MLGPRQSLSPFSLVELLVVIGIMAILMSILLPVTTKIRENGRRVACSANLRQLGTAMHLYMQEYDQSMCPHDDADSGNPEWRWDTIYLNLAPYYSDNHDILKCPKDRSWTRPASGATGRWWSYGFNHACGYGGAMMTTDFVDPPGTAVFFDSDESDGGVEDDGNRPYQNIASKAYRRHLQGLNVMFFDGHVQWRRPSSLTNAQFTLAQD
ncbi:MAG: type II secretion system protein [Lentisphaerae bacterium]|jgi:prepilin-type processing-associated H-X9-DG protein|nr:type II secretion system protein [Lentisphaerota bacterium]MBT4814105.1 type II secretion system protein [Lentisphaerota bacterium]MBT5611116.1 type II secretion system protein [Lentisphaerota bacterium]MBT7061282.1 type II secretion system protein [Lentisphaerota bacterium]MBT7846605.1 type II secretion system protein [Lentisphaerota bacterium]